MRIVKEYQRREFCKDRGCPSQKKIDAATDRATIDAVKKEECQDCMAHVFHKWLMERDYRIAVIE